MKELTVLVVIAAAVGAVLYVRSQTSRQRKDAISRIESERESRSGSPLADLFEAEGVPMPTTRAATMPPPGNDADDGSVVEPGQHP